MQENLLHIYSMFYLVRTLKENNGERINTDFVLEANDDSLIKDFFNNNKIILLGISQVQGRPSSAQYCGILQINKTTTANFCLKVDSAEALVQRCVDLNLPIISVNTFNNTITKETSTGIINKLQQIKIDQISKQKQIEQEEIAKQNKIMDNRKKEKIMSVINDTLQDIKKLEEQYANNMELINEKRKLNDLKEQLTKIKMWSNIEKATAILEETFALMEQMEMKTIYQLKEQEQKINENSVISNVDIISELEKIKRAQQTTKAGTKKSKSDLYYTYLGVVWLYQKFITKEAINKISHITTINKDIINYIWFWISWWALWIGILLFYYIITNNIHYNLLLWMISIWLLWIIRELLFIHKKDSFIINLIYIILAIILTIIIQRIIIIFFALI